MKISIIKTKGMYFPNKKYCTKDTWKIFKEIPETDPIITRFCATRCVPLTNITFYTLRSAIDWCKANNYKSYKIIE